MKAAVVVEAGQPPVYQDFREPSPAAGKTLIRVNASSISHVTKMRASGQHYSASGELPFIPGIDGVGVTDEGRRVYFIMPDAPFGATTNALAENLMSDEGVRLEFGVVRGLPLATPKGWPRLSRTRDLASLLPVPAAYRAPMCVDPRAELDRGGTCVSGHTGYLAALHDVGFRCARDVR